MRANREKEEEFLVLKSAAFFVYKPETRNEENSPQESKLPPLVVPCINSLTETFRLEKLWNVGCPLMRDKPVRPEARLLRKLRSKQPDLMLREYESNPKYSKFFN